MNRILDVYFHEKLAGKLIQTETGSLAFQYDSDFIENKILPAISISLPIREQIYEGNQVKAFFSGFLPEDLVKHKIARYLGVSEKNTFALLEVIGGECAGALSVYPEGQKPSFAEKEEIEILDDKKLSEILILLKRRPLLVGVDNIRLSLAGAQDKIAVGMKDGKIALMKDGLPTSHILKPMISDIKDSVQNELFCMRLAQSVGINVPMTEVRWIGDTPYYLIERYDRIKSENNKILRLHQEDFCQALSIMPELKYENEGGPGIIKCLDVLQKYSTKPAFDTLAFNEIVIFNYIIGNSDAHGKNFSLLYKDTLPELAPAYDLLSTAVIPNVSSKMAMKLGGKYEPKEVFLRHWHRLVPDTTLAKRNLDKQLLKMSDLILENAFNLKLKLSDEGIKSSIFEDIISTIQYRSNRIKELIKNQNTSIAS